MFSDGVAGLMDLIAPTRCAGCEWPGELMCGACLERLPRIEPVRACVRCGAPYGWLVCTECWQSDLAFAGAGALGEFEGVLARAVQLHKDAGEQRLGRLLGTLLAQAVDPGRLGDPDIVTWVPPTRAALVRRGFDHGQSIARSAARQWGLPCQAMLDRPRAPDQRLLGRSQRQHVARGSFTAAPTDRSVLVVDDVMTTGATLDAAARALLDAGATRVSAAVVARVW